MGDDEAEPHVESTPGAVAGTPIVPAQQELVVGGAVFGVLSYVVILLAALYVRIGSGVDAGRGLAGFLPGGLIGLSIATAVGLRGLRRWQDEHGLQVFTRRGARRFAWAGAQARDQLVVVPADR